MTMLQAATDSYSILLAKLQNSYPDLDDDTLRDTLEGATTLHELVAAVARAALRDEAYAEGLHGYIKDLKARLERLENRAAKQREAIRDALVAAKLSKMVAADLTLSIRSGSAGLVVLDPSKIPAPYWEAREPTLNKLAVLTDLRRGLTVAGTELAPPSPVLAIRVR